MKKTNIDGFNVRTYSNSFFVGLNENFAYFEDLRNRSINKNFLMQIKEELKISSSVDHICYAVTLEMDIVNYCDCFNKLRRGIYFS